MSCTELAGPGPGSGKELLRANGRSAHQLRSMQCERGPLQRADGSARWCQGGSVVLAAVHGPRGTASRKEDPERAVVEIVFRPRSGLAGPAERLAEATVRRTVEGVLIAALHPRTAVTVVLQVLSEDGGLLACALCAASAALVDAAVPLARTFVAATLAKTSEGVLLVDPDAAEEEAADAVATLAFAARGEAPGDVAPTLADGVLACRSAGPLSDGDFLAAVDLGRAAARCVAVFARASLEKSLSALV
ncbi:hypothetical protein WJX81_001421 [Elliptochloris bilobata]|uniref:Exoribonuclease phosphorolytic domain-containing protein n=1 Tax=Elliptochloris bilobata TaxID=381761 RepID=A0AAW1S687_9CHLO